MLLSKNAFIKINSFDAKYLQSKEPAFVISNRRFTEADELILIKLLLSYTPNFKILTTHPHYLNHPLLKPYFYEPFAYQFQKINLPSTSTAIRQSIEAVISEGKSCVIVMDYAIKRLGTLNRLQQNWRIMRWVKKAKLPIVPINFFSEHLNPNNASISVRVGKPISPEVQKMFKSYRRFGKFVQLKVMALGSSLEVRNFYHQIDSAKNVKEAVAPAISSELIEAEIEQLTYENLVASRSDFDVFVAGAFKIPNILKEIGRLRELTFREVNEGTGYSRDLDEYDLYYQQLIIWDRKAKKIVGGYRLGLGDEIFNRFGVEGFYINSLFKIEKGFYPIMKDAVELGRSYVVKEYQKHRLPLFLLWKGILHFLLKNPRYRYLYGPLSISKHYSDLSKSLIIEFVKKYYFDKKLAKHLEPRTPFVFKVPKADIDLILDSLENNIGELDNFIEDIEPDHFRLPVLLKQYIKQNARFISFNVDPNFSDVLDGFMILDLKNVPYSTIEALKKEQ